MNRIVFSRQSDEWETPWHIFNDLDAEFHFNLDPCATFDDEEEALHMAIKALRQQNMDAACGDKEWE